MKRLVSILIIMVSAASVAMAADNLVTAKQGELEKVLLKSNAKEFTVKISEDGTWVIEYNDSLGKKASNAAKSALEAAKGLGNAAKEKK